MRVFSPRATSTEIAKIISRCLAASVQRKLTSKLIGTLTYLGNKGTDVLTTTYVNLADPATRLVPNPAFGPVSWRGNVGNSTLNGLPANVRRQFQNGWLSSGNYIWSHSINDGSIGGRESGTPPNSFCRSCNKASSDDDVRHVFNAAAVGVPPGGRAWVYMSRREATRLATAKGYGSQRQSPADRALAEEFTAAERAGTPQNYTRSKAL